MRPTIRGAAAALAVPALVLPALVAASAPASAAIDPAPATAAGSWLAGELTDGIVLSPYLDENGDPYPDYGLTIDAGLAFHAAGDSVVVGEVSDAIAAQIDAYVAPGFGTSLSAGSAAKAAVLAQAAGDDPTSYGGRDLVADLESRVATEAPIAGRIQDDWDQADEFAADYANVFGQAFAVQALDAADSPSTDAATDFLLGQQCQEGFFRQSFTADPAAADQSCDSADGAPNVDVTALAVQALWSQRDDSEVAAHVGDAIGWLKSDQNADGSFGSDADISVENANSTGAAGYTLMLYGETEAAAKAAAWLRAHQATNVASCAAYATADAGAVLYGDAELTTAQDGPMDDQLVYQSVRATAQALPGLLAAPAGAGDPHAMFTAEYVKAGGAKPVAVTDAAPGEALCASLEKQAVLRYADLDGEATLPVRIPARTGVSKVEVADAEGVIGTVRINALGKAELKVALGKKKVERGAKQKVTVRQLAPAETATLKVGSTTVRGEANRQGVLTARLTVTGKPGARTVRVVGEFANRTGSAKFTVTR